MARSGLKRLATGAVLAPLLWLLIKVAPEWLFLTVATIGLARIAWECYGMSSCLNGHPLKWVGLLGVLVSAGVWSLRPLPASELALPVIATTFIAFLIVLRDRVEPVKMLERLQATLFPLLLVSFGAGHILLLRRYGGETGEDLVLLLFACVIAADTCAYYVGSAFGNSQFSPRISPNKSWEGVAGGVAGSVLAALIAHFWFYRTLPLGHAIVAGLLIGAMAVFGDLCESLMKRASGHKDSAALFPGHGGLFDRTDSLLFSAPALYGYVLLIPAAFLGAAR